jgi:predicted RNase H-like nuclease
VKDNSAFSFVGIDGCKGGWIAVEFRNGSLSGSVFQNIASVVASFPRSLRLIDIPIGLPDKDNPERRACEAEARRLLGSRHSSVFSAPSRESLSASNYIEACARNADVTGVKISMQCWGIVPKIKEVDDYLAHADTPSQSFREVHPEICFWALNGQRPLIHAKKTKAGFLERRGILERHLPGISKLVEDILKRYPRSAVARDDIMDAACAALTGFVGQPNLKNIPTCAQKDGVGLDMEMVYALIPTKGISFQAAGAG